MSSLKPLLPALFVALFFGQSDISNLTGFVIDYTSGAPIRGAEILVILKADRSETKTTTDDRGDYNLLGLRPGSYTLVLTKPGLKPELRSFEIKKGDTVRRDFAMDKMQ